MIGVLVFVLALLGLSQKIFTVDVGTAALFLSLFIMTAKAYPDAFPNRVDTWISRIDSFTGKEMQTRIIKLNEQKLQSQQVGWLAKVLAKV